jgi:hypothetical protein
VPRVERDAEVGKSSGPVFGNGGLGGHGWFMKMMAMSGLIGNECRREHIRVVGFGFTAFLQAKVPPLHQKAKVHH